MVRHNNVVPNQHFKKKWQFYVKTWFNQPARKHRRRDARKKKAAAIYPRPQAGALRPIVHGQTVKYNLKKRLGRGFSFEELKEAGISKALAPTIGIAVDHRRRNRSLESLQENVNRLKAYRASLVLFPRRKTAPKKGDADPEALSKAEQATGPLFPIAKVDSELEFVTLTEEQKEVKAYSALRLARTNAKWAGRREKRAAEAAAEEKNAAK